MFMERQVDMYDENDPVRWTQEVVKMQWIGMVKQQMNQSQQKKH